MLLIIIQARTQSKRLPNKVLTIFNKKSVIEIIVDRLKKIKFKKKILVATSKKKTDNKIKRLCEIKNIDYFRGSHHNVAQRFYKILLKNPEYKYFLRVSADSPVLDIKILSRMMSKIRYKYDIITNVMPRSFPKGQSFEIIKRDFFIKNYKKIISKNDKEHVTRKLYTLKSKIYNLSIKPKSDQFSLALDYKKDLVFFNYLFNKLKIKNQGYKHILKLRKNYEKN